MDKRKIIFILILLLHIVGFSQGNRNTIREAEKIMANPEYFYGDSGECKNKRKADEKAIEELLSAIANDNSLDPVYFPDGGDNDEQRERIMGTYSDILKKMASDIVISDADACGEWC